MRLTDFEEIYRAYFTDVYRYLLSLSKNEHTAEEITSETFFRALRTIDSFRGDCEIRVWLCHIAKNIYYTHLKKAQRTQSMDSSEFSRLPEDTAPLEEQFVRQVETQSIQAMLHNLQEPYREVFMWRVYAQLSFKEIGKLFRKTENWACVTYHRARVMIKQRLEDKEHEV